MKIKLQTLFVAGIFLGILGCKKNPVNRLSNPLADGAVPQASGVFNLYTDELLTGGGLAFIPGGENQAIDLSDKNSFAGINALKYEWNGGDVINNGVTPPVSQHLFAGFDLLVAADIAANASASAKNFSSFGYTTLKFSARGSLSQDTTVRIEGPNSASGTADRLELTSTQLTSTWQEFTLNVTPSQFSSVKTYLTLTFQYTQTPRITAGGNGGVIYLDNVRYE